MRCPRPTKTPGIAPPPNGHILATGYDARGRKQYRYHPDFRLAQDADKYDRCAAFGHALPLLRARLVDDLARRNLCQERVVGAVVRLLDLAALRVGNEQYAAANNSFGATTLRQRHAKLTGQTLRLRYRAKGGAKKEVAISDRSLTTLVRRLQDLPGQHLFQYEEDGEICTIGSEDVNAYIRDAMGDEFSAKHFRTWSASVEAFTFLYDAAEAANPESDAGACGRPAGQYPRGCSQGLCPPGDDRGGAGARRFCRGGGAAAARGQISFALRTRIFGLSAKCARRRSTAPHRLNPYQRGPQSSAMTFSILAAAQTVPTKASAAEPVAAANTNPLQDVRIWWDSSVAWVESHWLQIGIAIAAGLIIYFLLSMIRGFALKRAQSAPGQFTLTDIVGRVIHKTKSLVLAIISIRLVAGYAQPPALVLQIIQFVFTVAVVMQVAIWVREIVLGLIQRRAAEGHNETLSNAMGIIRLLISVALFAIAAIVILDNMGVNVTGLVAGLGIGGIAIGLAAQGIFSDLFASLSIIFDRPFRVGETIKYDTSIATVERIGLKSTHLRSINGELLVISNTNLLSKEITNYRQSPPSARPICDRGDLSDDARNAARAPCAAEGTGRGRRP